MSSSIYGIKAAVKNVYLKNSYFLVISKLLMKKCFAKLRYQVKTDDADRNPGQADFLGKGKSRG